MRSLCEGNGRKRSREEDNSEMVEALVKLLKPDNEWNMKIPSGVLEEKTERMSSAEKTYEELGMIEEGVAEGDGEREETDGGDLNGMVGKNKNWVEALMVWDEWPEAGEIAGGLGSKNWVENAAVRDEWYGNGEFDGVGSDNLPGSCMSWEDWPCPWSSEHEDMVFDWVWHPYFCEERMSFGGEEAPWEYDLWN
ncbi:unnamed protein product [Ilex paraguariensis]|uniref:Uncharacterized protein n=1 Tax=Ilex paraguariensis TaxID=185542 RepID=A0ABC8RY10_9AQUA